MPASFPDRFAPMLVATPFEICLRRRFVAGLTIVMLLFMALVGLGGWSLAKPAGDRGPAPRLEGVSLASEWRRAIATNARDVLAYSFSQDEVAAATIGEHVRATSARIGEIQRRLAELDADAVVRAAQREAARAKSRFEAKRAEMVGARENGTSDPTRLAQEMEPSVTAYLAAADRLVRSERDFAGGAP